jgi:hypothetical protein
MPFIALEVLSELAIHFCHILESFTTKLNSIFMFGTLISYMAIFAHPLEKVKISNG